MRRRAWVALVVAAGLLAPGGTALADDAPVPEGYAPPRSTVKVYTAWGTPRSQVSKFFTDPQEVDTKALEEALGVKDKGGAKEVAISDRFLFDFDSAELRPTAAASLDTLAVLLKESDGKIEVIGHTDSLGTDAINQPLSEERAQAVADYLEEQGIKADRITATGKGSSEPVADNTTSDGRDNPEGRQQNRRVEVRYQDE